MFLNAYQNGTHLEIFEPKDIKQKKDKIPSNLYYINIPRNASKIYESTLKGYILQLEGHTTKI